MAKPVSTGAGAGYEVPATAIAHCGGWTDERRRGWADPKIGLLRDKPPFTSHDAVETAIAACLAKQTNKNVARQAWAVVRQEVRQLALSGTEDIWVVLTQGGQRHFCEARAVEGAAAAGEAAAELGALVWVVPAAQAIRAARERFATLIESDAAAGGDVTPLRTPREREGG
jgi:hypothetical protein